MRPVIWVILAILVVAAIIFTVIARRGATPEGTIQRDTEDYMNFANRSDKRVERLEEKIASLEQEGVSSEALGPVNTKMSELKSAISDLRGTPNDENYKKVQNLYREAKKMYRDLGGVGEEEGMDEE
jgi:hypothetical protein